MKKLLFFGLAMIFSFTACQTQSDNYKQQSSTVESFRILNKSFSMKQKIEKEFQFLDFSNLVAQLKAF